MPAANDISWFCAVQIRFDLDLKVTVAINRASSFSRSSLSWDSRFEKESSSLFGNAYLILGKYLKLFTLLFKQHLRSFKQAAWIWFWRFSGPFIYGTRKQYLFNSDNIITALLALLRLYFGDVLSSILNQKQQKIKLFYQYFINRGFMLWIRQYNCVPVSLKN